MLFDINHNQKNDRTVHHSEGHLIAIGWFAQPLRRYALICEVSGFFDNINFESPEVFSDDQKAFLRAESTAESIANCVVVFGSLLTELQTNANGYEVIENQIWRIESMVCSESKTEEEYYLR